VATVEQCEQALRDLAARLAAKDPARRSTGFNRSLTCTVRDLEVIFSGQLRDGLLADIHRASARDAQIKLNLTSDDLLSLVDGKINMASAWATGRVKVEAGVRDLIKLRSIF
jgi:alkyl sulfatase BDS1-like metallo-beta-lactamase superfamily hydrolase